MKVSLVIIKSRLNIMKNIVIFVLKKYIKYKKVLW